MLPSGLRCSDPSLLPILEKEKLELSHPDLKPPHQELHRALIPSAQPGLCQGPELNVLPLKIVKESDQL